MFEMVPVLFLLYAGNTLLHLFGSWLFEASVWPLHGTYSFSLLSSYPGEARFGGVGSVEHELIWGTKVNKYMVVSTV